METPIKIPNNLLLKTAKERESRLLSSLRDLISLRKVEFSKGRRLKIRHYALAEVCTGGLWESSMITACTLHNVIRGLRETRSRIAEIYRLNLHK